jgi:glutathione S-transferase
MADPDLVLYHCPNACSQVAIYALEKAGAGHRIELVNLYQGQQQTAEYLAVSPLGKVPLLMVDGKPLMENAAILTLIGALWPDAGVFPANPSPLTRAEMVGGMSFCGGTLHPLVRGIANPQRMTTGDVEPVREMSRRLFEKSVKYAEKRLAENRWWLGEQSVVDVYLNWVLSVAQRAGFSLVSFPHLSGLKKRLMAEPAFARMQAQEAEFSQTLGV